MKLFSGRTLLLLGIITVVVILLAVISLREANTANTAPNAVWLKKAFEEKRVYYVILRTGLKHTINLEIAAEVAAKKPRFYLAKMEGSGKVDVSKLPKNKTWITISNRPSYYYYWYSLAPISATTLFLDAVLGREIYVELGDRKWLHFKIPDGEIIPTSGFLKVELREEQRESDFRKPSNQVKQY